MRGLREGEALFHAIIPLDVGLANRPRKQGHTVVDHPIPFQTPGVHGDDAGADALGGGQRLLATG